MNVVDCASADPARSYFDRSESSNNSMPKIKERSFIFWKCYAIKSFLSFRADGAGL